MDHMDHKQTLDYLVENVNPKAWFKFVKSRPEFFNWLNQQTPYKTNNISELIYLVKNPQQSPICKFNKKRLFKNFFEGYRVGCGRHCECVIESQKNKLKNWHKNLTDEQKNQLVENAKKTFREKYGVDNPMRSEKIKEKYFQENLKKYGVKSPIESKEIQNKIKQTNLKKYGVELPLQSKEIQKKCQEKYIEKYGKLMIVARKEKLKKYGTNWPEHVKEKIEKIKIEKYGTKSVFSLSEYREKINKKLHERLKEKYGEEIYDLLYNKEKLFLL